MDVEENGKLNFWTCLFHHLIESHVRDASEIVGIDDTHDKLPIDAGGIGDPNDKAFHVTIIRSARVWRLGVLCKSASIYTRPPISGTAIA